MLKNHFAFFLCFWTIFGSLYLTKSAASPRSDPFPDNHIWPLLEIREEIGSEIISRPVTQNDLSSPFGSRLKASEGFRYDFHRGIDIPTMRGTPVLAIADGEARLPGGFSGLTIQVEHSKASGKKYRATYVHLDSIPQVILDGIAAAPDGRFAVTQGTVVGYSGEADSGFDHLHFEIRDEGYYQEDCLNPLEILPYTDSNNISLQLVQNVNDLCDTDNDPVTPMPAQIINDFQNSLLTIKVTSPRNELDFNRLEVTILDLSEPTLPVVDSQSVDFTEWNQLFTPQADPTSLLDDRRYNGVTILPAAFNTSSSTYTVDFIFRELTIPGSVGPVRYVVRSFDLRGNQSELISDAPLPVELALFYGEVVLEGIRLHWTTSAEINNKGFYLYRTEGNLTHEKVTALIEGQAITNEPHKYSYLDQDVKSGVVYRYKISDIEQGTNIETFHPGIVVIFDEDHVGQTKLAVLNYALHDAFPNPFNPQTTIQFDLPFASPVTLRIYDGSGKLIKTLVDGDRGADFHSVEWNGTDDNGNGVSSGLYFYRLDAGDHFSQTKSIVLLK